MPPTLCAACIAPTKFRQRCILITSYSHNQLAKKSTSYYIRNMIDPDNKAVAKLMAIPPALLEEIANGNEEALAGTARVQLAYIMESMTMRCVDPQTSPSAVASIMEVLRKMAVNGKGEDAGSGGPQVVINITRAKDRAEGITIEGNSVEALAETA